jgi:hypothetical protein
MGILMLLLWIICVVIVFKIGFFINDHYWSQPLILLYNILYIIGAILIIILYFKCDESESTKYKKYKRLYLILEVKLSKIDKKNKRHDIKDRLENKIQSYLIKYSDFIRYSKSEPIQKVDWDRLNNEQLHLNLSDEIVLEIKWYYLKNLKRKYCDWFVYLSIILCLICGINYIIPIITIIIASIGIIYCLYFNYTLYNHKWDFVKIKYVKYKFIPFLYIVALSIISIVYPKSELYNTIQEIHGIIIGIILLLSWII